MITLKDIGLNFKKGGNNMNYELRKYTDNDYEFVYELKKNSYKKYVEENWGTWDEQQQRDHFKKFIEVYKNNTYIIQANNEEIGFYNDEYLEDGTYEIGNICIIPKYQGQGIGTKILKDKIEENKERDIIIQYFKQNPVGNLYKRLGFVDYNEKPYHYQLIKRR